MSIAGFYELTTGEPISASKTNENVRNVDASSQYHDGWRVLSGLTVSIGAGLTVSVAAGSAHIQRNITFAGAQTVGSIPPSVTRYLWLLAPTVQTDDGSGNLTDTTGTFTLTPTLANPGAAAALLATIVSGVSTITSVDNTVAHRAAEWSDQDTYVIGNAVTVDHLNKRVGIGVTAPAYALDMALSGDGGIARIDSLLMPNVASAPSTVAAATLAYSKSGDLYMKDASGNEIRISANAAIYLSSVARPALTLKTSGTYTITTPTTVVPPEVA